MVSFLSGIYSLDSLLAAPVYLKIGFPTVCDGRSTSPRPENPAEKIEIKWISCSEIGILGGICLESDSWYDEGAITVCEKRAWRFRQCFDAVCWHPSCLIPLFCWMPNVDLVDGVGRKKKERGVLNLRRKQREKENRLAAGMKNWFGKHRQTLYTCLSVRGLLDFSMILLISV